MRWRNRKIEVVRQSMSASPRREEERAANTVSAVYIASVQKVILNDLMIESVRAVNPTRVGRRDGRVSLCDASFFYLDSGSQHQIVCPKLSSRILVSYWKR